MRSMGPAGSFDCAADVNCGLGNVGVFMFWGRFRELPINLCEVEFAAKQQHY